MKRKLIHLENDQIFVMTWTQIRNKIYLINVLNLAVRKCSSITPARKGGPAQKC